jgi:hypothetical protein
VGGDIFEVRQARGVARHAVAVVLDREIMRAVLAAPGDRDHAGVGVDAVLDELGDRLERVRLRQGDDADGVPVIADAQLAALVAPGFQPRSPRDLAPAGRWLVGPRSRLASLMHGRAAGCRRGGSAPDFITISI